MLALIASVGGRKSRYLCGCGVETIAFTSNVNRGHTVSCGCHRRAVTSQRSKTHGLSGYDENGKRSRTYICWKGMRSRCDNPKSKDFANYGGRGIYYAPKWAAFEGFLADLGEPPEGTSLDRIDVNGPYCIDNCRWADRITQMNNKTCNHHISHDGRTQTLAQWSRETGIGLHTLLKRVQRGVPADVALSTKGYLRWPTNDASTGLIRIA